MPRKPIALTIVLVLAAACGAQPDTELTASSTAQADTPRRPSLSPRKVVHPLRGSTALRAPRAADTIPIEYNGGYVMGGTLDVYVVWYGDWSGSTATAILPDFLQHLGGSPYYAINTTYDDDFGRQVANSITVVGSYDDAYSRGTSLGDGDVSGIVTDAIAAGAFPVDVHGLYFVFTSADVSEGDFCGGYCGYHSSTVVNGTWIKYAFVGDAAQCPSGCEPQSTSPNGSASADGMASIVAHELEETASDPYADAWFDANGDENGDKCAWTFGATFTTDSGARANMRLGDRDYLVQENWVNVAGGGYCALSF
jgi:hypothetical protein